MLLELGPLPTDAVLQWSRVARRVICELRLEPGDLDGIVSDDLLAGWAHLIDGWETSASEHRGTNPSLDFRWSHTIDTEMAEYLLHGLDHALHSPHLRSRFTDEEAKAHWGLTCCVVQAFVDGLSTEGHCHEHYVDQVRASFSTALDH